MKTYAKTIKKNRLEIMNDDDSESPREWGNLSILILKDTPTGCDSYLTRQLVNSYRNVANSEDHMQAMIEIVEEFENDTVVYSSFITKYEHSGIKYFLGIRSGWDYGISGMIFVTQKSLDEYGIENGEKEIEKRLGYEIDSFNSWVNGDVYYFNLYDEEGNLQDSMGSLYSLEDVKRELPEEFKDEDMNNYLNT